PPSQPPPAAAEAEAAPAAEAGPEVTCPQCSHVNPQNNRFCASCGYNLAALQQAPAPAAAPAAGPPVTGPVLLTALRADGSEAGNFQLPEAPTVTVGRDTRSIFASDSSLSPRHASFSRANGLTVRDEGSLNGVYLKHTPNAPWP